MRLIMIRAGLAAAVLVSGSIGSAHALTIGFSSCAAAPGSGLTSCDAGAAITTFDSTSLGSLPSGYSGNGAVRQGTVSGSYAQPGGPWPTNLQGDNTPYLSVPSTGGNGTVTLTLSSAYNYFGLYWGSMDDYNTLKFYSGDTLVETVNGAAVITAANLLGNQTNVGSNRYVDFYFGAASFDRIEFSSNGYAFESDNHALANVPEPGMLALLGFGLLCLSASRRRVTA